MTGRNPRRISPVSPILRCRRLAKVCRRRAASLFDARLPTVQGIGKPRRSTRATPGRRGNRPPLPHFPGSQGKCRTRSGLKVTDFDLPTGEAKPGPKAPRRHIRHIRTSSSAAGLHRRTPGSSFAAGHHPRIRNSSTIASLRRRIPAKPTNKAPRLTRVNRCCTVMVTGVRFPPDLRPR